MDFGLEYYYSLLGCAITLMVLGICGLAWGVKAIVALSKNAMKGGNER